MISERLKKLRVAGFEKGKNEVGERLDISRDVLGPVQIYNNYLRIGIKSIPYDSQKYPGLKEHDITNIGKLKYNTNERI